MPTDEELFKIIVQVQGQADVERLTAAVRKEEDAIRLLTAELRLGAISQAQFDAAAKKSAASIAASNAQMAQAGAGIGKWGNAITQAGYAVDDLQYGMKGIANNIQPILQSIPGLAKFAGPIAIAAIAAYQLYEHWDQLADALGMGRVRTAAEEMEELRKKTELTADEAERLAKVDSLASKVKELRGAKTDDQKSSEDAATRAIVENGGIKSVAARIRQSAPDLVDASGDVPAAKAAYDKFKKETEFNKSGGEFAVIAEMQRLNEVLSKARDDAAEKLAATASGANREKFAGMFQGTKLGTDLANADPDMIRQKEDEAARIQDNADHEARMNAFENQGNDQRNQRAQQFAGNASPAARKIVLGAAASGGEVNVGELTRQLGADLASAGIPEKDVGEFAGKVAQVLMEETRKKLEDEAAKTGTTKEAAAGVGLVDLQIAEANRFRQSMQQNLELTQQDHKTPSVLGSDEFAKSLLSAHPRSDEEIAKKQLDEAQKAVAQLEQIKTGLQNIGRLR